jgi:hypothetical protein
MAPAAAVVTAAVAGCWRRWKLRCAARSQHRRRAYTAPTPTLL